MAKFPFQLSRTLPATSIKLDVLIAAIVFFFAAYIAVEFLRDVKVIFFYQTQMPETVMAACGRPFGRPATLPAPLLDFLYMRTLTFDCTQLASVSDTGAVGFLTAAHLYLALTASYLWRWLGVSYQNLWPWLAVMHGAYAAGCFVLGRLFFSLIVASVFGILIAVSPIAISMLFWPRDYSKAPFIIWALILLVLAVRGSRPRLVILLSPVIGIVLGLGSGFRPDVMVFIPIVLIIMLVGLDPKIGIKHRLAASLIVITVFFGLVYGTRAGNIGGSGGFLLMEGQTEPFREFLGLDPAPYDLGWKYSDELTFSSVVSDVRRLNPTEYDAEEARSTQVTQGMRIATSHVLRWLPLFSADVAARALKSAVMIAGFPALLASDRLALDPARMPYPATTPIAQWTAKGMTFIAQPWMPAIGVLGLAAFLVRLSAYSTREAFCVGAILLALITYPSIQFSMRHIFCFEILFWLAVASLIDVICNFSAFRRGLARSVFWLGGGVIAVSVLYATLALAQNYLLKREVTRILAGPKAPIARDTSNWGEDQVLFTLPVPEQYQALVDGPLDSLTPPRIERETPTDIRAASDRLIVEIGGPACAARRISMTFAYEKRLTAWQPLDRTLSIAIPLPAQGTTTIIAPAFYRPTQHFLGLAVPAAVSDCIQSIVRVDDSKRLPAIFSAVLAPEWREQSFRLKF